MNQLTKTLAPISDRAWERIEGDARDALREHLLARRVVDFDGPHGLTFGAVNLGSLARVELGEGILAGKRVVQPLFEVRVPFTLLRSAIDDAARGAPDFDTGPVVHAARRLAELEDRAVLHGLGPADIRGLTQASSHPPVRLGPDPLGFAEAVTSALIQLDDAAVSGPYALILGSSPFRKLGGLSSTYPPIQAITKLIGGPVLHSRILQGGLLVSLRGGDFMLSVGQDAAIGYTRHDAERIELYFIESFTFLVIGTDAVVKLDE